MTAAVVRLRRALVPAAAVATTLHASIAGAWRRRRRIGVGAGRRRRRRRWRRLDRWCFDRACPDRRFACSRRRRRRGGCRCRCRLRGCGSRSRRLRVRVRGEARSQAREAQEAHDRNLARHRPPRFEPPATAFYRCHSATANLSCSPFVRVRSRVRRAFPAAHGGEVRSDRVARAYTCARLGMWRIAGGGALWRGLGDSMRGRS